jgi:vacuolar-type H+-ATPase subunit F/Vma7
MELTVRVLCSPEVAPGFALAGIAVDAAEEATAADAVRRLASEESVGIILLEDRLDRALPSDLRARIDRMQTPILVPFPSPAWERRGLAEQYVLEILRQAVGYRVRAR